MKESKLIEMQNRIAKIGEVLNELIKKLQQVDQLAKGTLTAFQLNIGKDEWAKLVEELKDHKVHLVITDGAKKTMEYELPDWNPKSYSEKDNSIKIFKETIEKNIEKK